MKKQSIVGLVGAICWTVTAGFIGYVIGDNCGLDWELLGQFLLVYIPPIAGSICITWFVKDNCIKRETKVIDKNEKA